MTLFVCVAEPIRLDDLLLMVLTKSPYFTSQLLTNVFWPGAPAMR
jgi:hypothetical protein